MNLDAYRILSEPYYQLVGDNPEPSRWLNQCARLRRGPRSSCCPARRLCAFRRGIENRWRADVVDAEQLDVVLTDIQERHCRVRRPVHGAKVGGGSTPRISSRSPAWKTCTFTEVFVPKSNTKVSLPRRQLHSARCR
jgi:hypothetical protein